MYYEYLGDKKALEQIKNCSICINSSEGIRNIKNYRDTWEGDLVYVENIPLYGESVNNHIIRMGEMVRYRPIKTGINNGNNKIIIYGSTRNRAYKKLEKILNNMSYGDVKRVSKSEYYFTADLMNGDRYMAVIANDNARMHRWHYAFIDNLIDIKVLDQIVFPCGLCGNMYEYY